MSLNKKIADNLFEISKLNPFKNNRKRETVEIRSVLIKILRDYQEMTLCQIATFFIHNNQKMDHSSVLYSLRNYDIYIRYNPQLEKWHDFVVDSLFESGNYNESFIVKRRILKDRIDGLNKKNLDELLYYSQALASEQSKGIYYIWV